MCGHRAPTNRPLWPETQCWTAQMSCPDLRSQSIPSGRTQKQGTGSRPHGLSTMDNDRSRCQHCWKEGPMRRCLLTAVAALSLVALTVAPRTVTAATSCKVGKWICVASSTEPLKVWVKSTGNASHDVAEARQVVSLFDSLWSPETALMGPPVPDKGTSNHGTKGDDGNDDSRIDVYAMHGNNEVVHRNGRPRSLGGDIAATWVTGPYGTGGRPHNSSGYMQVNLDRINSSGFKSDVAHEFFHLLQAAHETDASSNCPNDEWWFDEASAVWAESYFVPETAPDEAYSWLSQFQASSLGLTDRSDVQHYYESFVW